MALKGANCIMRKFLKKKLQLTGVKTQTYIKKGCYMKKCILCKSLEVFSKITAEVSISRTALENGLIYYKKKYICKQCYRDVEMVIDGLIYPSWFNI